MMEKEPEGRPSAAVREAQAKRADLEAARIKQALRLGQLEEIAQWLDESGVGRRPNLELVERSSFESTFAAAYPDLAPQVPRTSPWLTDGYVAEELGVALFGDQRVGPLTNGERQLLEKAGLLHAKDDASNLLKGPEPSLLAKLKARASPLISNGTMFTHAMFDRMVAEEGGNLPRARRRHLLKEVVPEQLRATPGTSPSRRRQNDRRPQGGRKIFCRWHKHLVIAKHGDHLAMMFKDRSHA